MKIKRLITLIETLALTGLVSVGFSSWLIIETNPAVISGRVNVEEVFNNNNYLSIKNLSFSDYCKDGFYDDYTFGTASNNNAGILEFDIIIDVKKYREELKTNPSMLKLDVLLTYSKYYDQNGDFEGLDIISRSISVSSDGVQTVNINNYFKCIYDGSESSTVTRTVYTAVNYSENIPSPNLNSIYVLNGINSVNKIVMNLIYEFNLVGGWKETDYLDIIGEGVPFYIHSTLENTQ